MSDIQDLFGLEEGSAHLEEALTHPSFANERRQALNNQRLEFLGDAVLELCISELLCRAFPEADEGRLTRLRASVVNTDALAAFARSHDISAALLLGRGAEASDLRNSTNVLADLVEALIAACYLDCGMQAARAACTAIIAPELERLRNDEGLDPKTALQQEVQATGGPPPAYEVVDSGGPAHERWFRVRATVGGVGVAEGEGKSKRGAEREAARAALESGSWRGQLDAEEPRDEPSE